MQETILSIIDTSLHAYVAILIKSILFTGKEKQSGEMPAIQTDGFLLLFILLQLRQIFLSRLLLWRRILVCGKKRPTKWEKNKRTNNLSYSCATMLLYIVLPAVVLRNLYYIHAVWAPTSKNKSFGIAPTQPKFKCYPINFKMYYCFATQNTHYFFAIKPTYCYNYYLWGYAPYAMGRTPGKEGKNKDLMVAERKKNPSGKKKQWWYAM